jgi:trehalose/maltose hydrolase-like predicted phosphorylase
VPACPERPDHGSPARNPPDGRFEAAVFSLASGGGAPERELGELIGEACALGLHVGVLTPATLEEAKQLIPVDPTGPGSLHLITQDGLQRYLVDDHGPSELPSRPASVPDGNRGAQRAAAVRWLLGQLSLRGIPPALALLIAVPWEPRAPLEPYTTPAVVGDPHDEPLPLARSVLRDQVRRRARAELPGIVADPTWTLAIEDPGPEAERVAESLMTLADGLIGTRGSPLGAHPASVPAVRAAGLYRGAGRDSELLTLPLWNRLPLSLALDTPIRRVLDMRSGLLHEEIGSGRDRLDALLISSLARPGVAVLRCEGPTDLLPTGTPLQSADSAAGLRRGRRRDRSWISAQAEPGGAVAAAVETTTESGPRRVLDRLAAYEVDPQSPPTPENALRRLDSCEEAGFERLLAEHRAAWAQRWQDADVRIGGDPELQLGIRFALFHLIASVGDSGEAAVGARGLSGGAYRGHVFWDACVYVLPFLAATHPPAARAMLEYRIRRLPAALAAARALGRAGARFPWESAASGENVTPTVAPLRSGEEIRVRTGELEEHVVADVAWAVHCYVGWSGDDAFMLGPGGALMVETARYWASRAELGADSRAHIRGVIGPDEYHVDVDDNAYTNVMARWNLRRAAEVASGGGLGVSRAERDAWLALADSLVDGYEPESGLYEQFRGFFALEPTVIADLAPHRPVAAELLLGGFDRLRRSQVVKQADVLMLHHLVPYEVAEGSLRANIDFYEPRTAHASSLSPGIHAGLLARVGRLEEACEALRLTTRIDLDDLSDTTAGGLHLAAMGSVWQALVHGFAGIRPERDRLRVEPRLPEAWGPIEIRLRFRGAHVTLGFEGSRVVVSSSHPLEVISAEREVEFTLAGEGRAGAWGLE